MWMNVNLCLVKIMLLVLMRLTNTHALAHQDLWENSVSLVRTVTYLTNKDHISAFIKDNENFWFQLHEDLTLLQTRDNLYVD